MYLYVLITYVFRISLEILTEVDNFNSIQTSQILVAFQQSLYQIQMIQENFQLFLIFGTMDDGSSDDFVNLQVTDRKMSSCLLTKPFRRYFGSVATL